MINHPRSVCIYGSGPAGISAAQLAREHCAVVVVCDPEPAMSFRSLLRTWTRLKIEPYYGGRVPEGDFDAVILTRAVGSDASLAGEISGRRMSASQFAALWPGCPFAAALLAVMRDMPELETLNLRGSGSLIAKARLADKRAEQVRLRKERAAKRAEEERERSARRMHRGGIA